MDLEHKVGQLLVIGLPGTQVDSEARDLLDTIQPGGVLLGSHNIESAQQVAEFTGGIRSTLKVPPLVAIDQEGGERDPLKAIYSPMPSADRLCASDDASIAARLGEIAAEALRTLGFNINFAPVLDIAVTDSSDNGLRGRCLGDTVANVVRLAGAYLEGLQHGGVVGAGKHFPGLGAAKEDPRSILPIIDAARDELLKRDISPYTELFSKINARLNALIIGHAHYTAFDGPDGIPASLSKKIVTGLLREELGFKGLAISDDLGLGAVSASRDLGEAAVAAIEAGNDMITVARSAESATLAWQSLVDAARQERVKPASIKRSFDHIARVKSMLSPPHALTDMSISRLRERIAELNVALQQSR